MTNPSAPTTPSDSRRFTIEIGRAHLLGAAIGMGILGFVIALPLFYFKSEVRGWGKLLGCSAGVGVFVGIVARARGGGKEKRVTVDDSGIMLENEKERLVLPWAEVERVNHWVHGDHYWEFITPHRTRPVVMKGFGFSPGECKGLTEALQRYKAVVEEAVGAKRMLEDAFVH